MDSKDTESHIKNTAKKIFFTMGRLNAKTQEIADEAQVNRALLHYYFRSREKLFEIVLKEALEESHREFFAIAASDKPFEKKVQEIVSHMLERTIKYPFMETFMVSEMIKNPDKILMIPTVGKDNVSRKKFREEIQAYIDDNGLPHIKPQHFLANLFAMCSYPSVVKPLLMNLFQYDETQFKNFIQERKLVITKLLLGKK
jgi:TetR/AcrR family transcriptional regulator